ncbi:MAG TPA: hypothetical protein VFZ96_08120 [Actinomycetota bacterium]|nr:hypothetical protein [Actinomycetota bacterium]
MAQSSSGFDMSKMSMGSKILLGSGVLLLIFSFFAWQKVCVLDIACVNAGSMWGGSGAIFGILGGLALIALLVWEGLQVAGTDVSVGQPPSRISAYLGFATAGLVVLKFVFALTESPAFGAFIGLILALGVGYGAWMRFQEPAAMPAAPTNEGLA